MSSSIVVDNSDTLGGLHCNLVLSATNMLGCYLNLFNRITTSCTWSIVYFLKLSCLFFLG